MSPPPAGITVQPETQSALKGNNVTFLCTAASSSDSPMTFAWKKDNEVLNDAEIHNQAHLRVQGRVGGETEVTEYTSTLQLRTVDFSSEGKYQCVISNHFGSSYSTKAKLTVHSKFEMGGAELLPARSKKQNVFNPINVCFVTVRAGATARLECAAGGHPSPQIAWQKDGGTDFPATEDIGVYSCTAQNTAGAISANATLTVLGESRRKLYGCLCWVARAHGETAVLQCIAGGSPAPRLNWTKEESPLVVTERHFFAAANQLLIIVDVTEADAGKYTCEMSNTLGTERGSVRLVVIPNPNSTCPPRVLWLTGRMGTCHPRVEAVIRA
uniref:Leucine-rich repeats and immunoglobulin-like domains 3 n=1 Tax=Oryzias sinensis TaxID=183150 RepID=A0A8C7YPY8_9TELE